VTTERALVGTHATRCQDSIDDRIIQRCDTFDYVNEYTPSAAKREN